MEIYIYTEKGIYIQDFWRDIRIFVILKIPTYQRLNLVFFINSSKIAYTV